MKILRYIILFLLLASPVGATNYFVDSGASDGGDGSSGTPWNELSDITGLSSGDDVYLKCGSTFTEERVNVTWDGVDENNYSVVGAYYGTDTIGVSGNKPIIDGNAVAPGENNALIEIQDNHDYIHVTNIHVTNSDGYGIYYNSGSDYGKVTNCDVDLSYSWGISIRANSTVESCTLTANSRMSDDGLPVYAGSIKPLGNTTIIRYNKIISSYGEGITLKAGTSGHTVMYNYVSDTCSVGIYLQGASTSEIAYNLVVGTNDTTFHYALGDWANAGIRINIESFATASAIGNKIHNNIVINRSGGIELKNSKDDPTYTVEDNYIYNNTCIDNNYNFVFSNLNDCLDDGVNYFKNNLGYIDSGDCTRNVNLIGDNIDGWSSDTYSDYNAYDPNYGDSDTELQGTHDQAGDAKLATVSWRGTAKVNDETFTIADLVIESGSIVIDNGTDLGVDYDDGWDPSTSLPPSSVDTKDQDLFGAGWDIGAIVYNLYMTDFTPPSGAEDQSITVDGHWTNPTGTNENIIYLDKKAVHDPPTTEIHSGSAVETKDFGTLSYDTEYAWRNDIVHDGGTQTGIVYYFTTTTEQNPPAPSGSGIKFLKKGVAGKFLKKGVAIGN